MDEPSQVIIAEAAVTAAHQPARRRLFPGRRRRVYPPPLPYCENCLTPLSGPFCAQCGQHAIDYRRSFGRFFGDVLDSFLNWDSKFFATMALLLVRPWRLTLAFLHGERVRYVHPLRLYLLVSVFFFFGVHELAQQANFQQTTIHSKKARSDAQKMIDDIFDRPGTKDDAQADEEKRVTKSGGLVVVETDKDDKDAQGFERWMNQQIKQKIGEDGVNSKVFFMAVISNLPAMMLCCIPLFALVLRILYLRRGYFFVDHLIYALHIHAFAYMAILLIGFVIAEGAKVLPGASPFIIAALVVASICLLLLSIRQVYRQAWIWSIAKFLIGGAVYVIVLSLALGATFFITLAMP